MTGDKQKEENDLKRAMFAVSDAVLGAAVLLALGVYGGAWIDNKLHSSPWVSVTLSILGAGLGLARMVAKANALESKSKPKSSREDSRESKSPQTGGQNAGGSNPSDSKTCLPFEQFTQEEQK